MTTQLMSWAQPPQSELVFDDYSKNLLRSDRVEETSVVFSPDGNYLYFSRKGAIFNFGQHNEEDIWYSKRQEAPNSWSAPMNMGPQINSEKAEKIVAISEDQQALYLSRQTDDLPILLRYERIGRRWSEPQLVQIPGLEKLSAIEHFSVNSSDRFLLLCAREQAQSDLDIYFSIKNTAGEWSALKAMVLPFNQSSDECSAFLAADNKTLYFATKGIEGYGGYDLFYCRKTGAAWNQWTQPENLGPTVNSTSDEFGLSMPQSGEKIAYLSNIKAGQLKVYFGRTPEGMEPEKDLFGKVGGGE